MEPPNEAAMDGPASNGTHVGSNGDAPTSAPVARPDTVPGMNQAQMATPLLPNSQQITAGV